MTPRDIAIQHRDAIEDAARPTPAEVERLQAARRRRDETQAAYEAAAAAWHAVLYGGAKPPEGLNHLHLEQTKVAAMATWVEANNDANRIEREILVSRTMRRRMAKFRWEAYLAEARAEAPPEPPYFATVRA